KGFAGAKFAHVVSASLRAEASSLLVVLFDVGLLVPRLETVVLLGRSGEPATRATGVKAALEETADDLRLTERPTPSQQASEEGIETFGRSEDQVMTSLDLIEIPLVSEPLAAGLGSEHGDAAVDPTMAEGGDGLRCEGLAGALEDLRVVDLDEEVVAHL